MYNQEYLIKSENQIQEETIKDFIQVFRQGIECLIDTYGKNEIFEKILKL